MDTMAGARDAEGNYERGVFGKAHSILQDYTKHTSQLQKTL
jgi:hypothetical protein